jgi:hypothetical protein
MNLLSVASEALQDVILITKFDFMKNKSSSSEGKSKTGDETPVRTNN